MAEDRYTFAQARTRLEEIVVQVRKKDTSLEKSLDLLEEGVRLANTCTELSDHTEWRSVAAEQEPSREADDREPTAETDRDDVASVEPAVAAVPHEDGDEVGESDGGDSDIAQVSPDIAGGDGAADDGQESPA